MRRKSFGARDVHQIVDAAVLRQHKRPNLRPFARHLSGDGAFERFGTRDLPRPFRPLGNIAHAEEEFPKVGREIGYRTAAFPARRVQRDNRRGPSRLVRDVRDFRRERFLAGSDLSVLRAELGVAETIPDGRIFFREIDNAVRGRFFIDRFNVSDERRAGSERQRNDESGHEASHG